jgi:hypothetical protein
MGVSSFSQSLVASRGSVVSHLTHSKQMAKLKMPNKTLTSGYVVNFDNSMTKDADFLLSVQSANTFGWDWNISPSFVPAVSTYDNLYGVTGLGLYYQYKKSGNVTYLNALRNACTYMIGHSTIQDADAIKLLLLFQDIPGETAGIYQNAAQAKYDARITAAGSATLFAQGIRDERGINEGYKNGIIPWDIGEYAVVAQLLFNKFGGSYHQNAVDIAEVIYQDAFKSNPGYFKPYGTQNRGWDPTWKTTNYFWYSLGITGIINAFNYSGTHTDSLPGLVNILNNGCKFTTGVVRGAYSWSYGANSTDDDWQSTAYVVMALNDYNKSANQNNINSACYYLSTTQDQTTGAWIYGDGTTTTEVDGESTSALYFGTKAAAENVDITYNSSSCGGHFWGYDAFNLIQDGITVASSGTTINVAIGTYPENLSINNNLTLSGTNAVISPVTGDVVSVGASVTNLVLSGFNLIAPTGRLALKNSSGSTVDARNNLWGQITNRATITHSITGSVNFAPWTGMLPGIPSTSWPKGNTNVFELTPKLEYYLLFDVTGTPSYVTYVSPTAGTYNNLVGLTTATSAQVGAGVLTGGNTYYWDVAYSIGGNYSDFSTEETFRVDNSLGGTPPVPVPCWPVNNARVFEAHPTLEWFLVGNYSGAVTYDIELWNITTGSKVFNPLAISGSSLTVTPALTGGTPYKWRIRANSTANGSSNFSSYAYFSVDNSVVGGIPPKPIPTWPTNGADLFSTSTNLEWFLGGNFSETVNYDVVVTDVTLGSTAYSQSGISGLSANVPILLAGHAYSWIVTVHGSSASTSSDPALFHVDATQGGNPVPHPTWPTSNASIFELKPTFEWFLLSTPASDAVIQLEIKPVSVPFNGTPSFTTPTSANTFQIPTDLAASTSYHWRVRLISTLAGNSAWSDVSLTGGSTFTTSIFATLPVPSPGSPSSGAYIASNSVSLNWYTTSTASDNLLYRVEVSSSPNMTSPVLQYDDVSDLSKVITTPHDGNYYWRVIAKDQSGEYSAYSSNGSFHTAGTTGIKNETNLIPTKFEVFQNYPNPFNPSTIIKYGLPEAANVTVKVFNMLGQEVRTLVNDYKNAGTFNVQWNGDNNSGQKVTSGIYIFRVTAGNNAATMKMILLK